MRILLKFLSLIACALCTVPTFADTPRPVITIAAQEMPDLLKAGADLPYNKLMELLLDGAPADLTITIYPGQRGVMQWVRQESQCLFGNITLPGGKRIPHSVLSEEEFSNLILAGPFNRIAVHMFALHEIPPTDARTIGAQLVAVDTIAHTDTSLYAPALRRLKYAKVPSTLEAFRLLEQGRVQMVLAYGIDAALALDKLKIAADVRYDPSAPILEFEENLACWKSPETEALVTHVQKRISNTRKSGALARHFPQIPGDRP
ncbi:MULTISPECIES: hypothetical protein [Kordiimonas]|uniref:hypothetical protein n=1 Tax=Kordiimonas TaxID=288021 RepID=UPI002580A869|nr:hypothetical protein [Kordiimonas sp. UBA4487]